MNTNSFEPVYKNNRRECSILDPYHLSKGTALWYHPNAIETGSCSNDCCAYYTCNICGLKFKEELPN